VAAPRSHGRAVTYEEIRNAILAAAAGKVNG